MTLPVPVLGFWPENHIPFHSVASFISSSVVFSVASFLSPHLFCRLDFSFFFRFLGLFSRRLLGRLFGCVLGRLLFSFSFLSAIFLLFFVLSSLLATPVSLSFYLFLSFLIFFSNLVSSFGCFFM